MSARRAGSLLPERIPGVVQHEQMPLGNGLFTVGDQAGIGNGDAAAALRNHRLWVVSILPQRVVHTGRPLP